MRETGEHGLDVLKDCTGMVRYGYLALTESRRTELVLRGVDFLFVFGTFAGVELLRDQRSSFTTPVGEFVTTCGFLPLGYGQQYLLVSLDCGGFVGLDQITNGRDRNVNGFGSSSPGSGVGGMLPTDPDSTESKDSSW